MSGKNLAYTVVIALGVVVLVERYKAQSLPLPAAVRVR